MPMPTFKIELDAENLAHLYQFLNDIITVKKCQRQTGTAVLIQPDMKLVDHYLGCATFLKETIEDQTGIVIKPV